MDTGRVLYDYITAKYNDLVNFSNISGITHDALEAVLLKDNISTEISMAINLLEVLNLDIEKMVFSNQIKDSVQGNTARITKKSGKSDSAAIKHEIYNRCMKLSEMEKKKVLEYICSLTVIE